MFVMFAICTLAPPGSRCEEPGHESVAQQRRGDGKNDFVGDQQIDPRHLDCTDDRIKLVVLDLDAATERSLDIL